jgi:hypothetical protein
MATTLECIPKPTTCVKNRPVISVKKSSMGVVTPPPLRKQKKTSVISTRKVQFPVSFYTHSAIYSVISNAECDTKPTRVILIRMRVNYTPARCASYTQCDFDRHECDSNQRRSGHITRWEKSFIFLISQNLEIFCLGSDDDPL